MNRKMVLLISLPSDRRLIDRILFCSKISTRSALGNWFGKSVKLLTCMLSWVSLPRFFTGIFTFWTWLYDKSSTSRFSKFSNTSIGTFVILLKGSFTTLIDQGKPFKIHDYVIVMSSLSHYVIKNFYYLGIFPSGASISSFLETSKYSSDKFWKSLGVIFVILLSDNVNALVNAF